MQKHLFEDHPKSLAVRRSAYRPGSSTSRLSAKIALQEEGDVLEKIAL
jgi:hypothetical protein